MELAICELEEIALNKDVSREIESINEYFISIINPPSYNGSSSIEIKYELSFEQTCHFLSKHTNKDVKKLTVKEFYSLFQFIKDSNKGE